MHAVLVVTCHIYSDGNGHGNGNGHGSKLSREFEFRITICASGYGGGHGATMRLVRRAPSAVLRTALLVNSRGSCGRDGRLARPPAQIDASHGFP